MTEQAKPTPGPWLVRAPDNGIYDTEDEIANVVARGPYGLITLAEEVDIADASLIAAAPDMLEALEAVAEGHATHDTVLAAIAKAKGGRA